MSFIAQEAVFEAVVKLSGLERRVLIVLASYADDVGGSCYPKQETLARRSGLTPRDVRRVLRQLERRGCCPLSNARANITTRGTTPLGRFLQRGTSPLWDGEFREGMDRHPEGGNATVREGTASRSFNQPFNDP